MKLCTLTLFCVGFVFADTKIKKPNIILMVADDMGVNDIGYVNPEVHSPNLDSLAAEGVKLKNNYVMNVCTPTRHALMTGRYPFKTQMSHIVLFPAQAHCSPTDIEFLPGRLKKYNYNTYMTGKWHLGFCQEACLPTNRGFDHFYGFYQGEQDYYKHTSGADGMVGYDWRDGTKVDWSVDGIFDTYIMNDWLKKQLDNYNNEDPFFMYITWPNVHTPLKSPQKYYDIYKDIEGMSEGRKQYLGLVSAMDDAVGNLTRVLKDNRLYDDTLIIFTSDNGGEHGGNSDNLPYRGSKGSFFEGGVRAQAFVHGKLLEKTGYTHQGMFHAIDWVPTIMTMIGGEIGMTGDEIDGVDQSDMILRGQKSKRTDVILNIDMLPMPMMGQAALMHFPKAFLNMTGDDFVVTSKDGHKLIWGSPGVSDGYGHNVTLFYNDRDNLDMIGLYQTSDPDQPTLTRRAAFDFSPENKAVMTAIDAYLRFDPKHIESGHVSLFDLLHDPYEKRDIASVKPDVVLDMKKYILEQLHDYVPVPRSGRFDLAGADPALPKHSNVWSTGWCEWMNITMEAGRQYVAKYGFI